MSRERKPSTVPSVVVYGPHGCGKTRSAEALMNRLGLKYANELDNRRRVEKTGVMYLTSHDLTGYKQWCGLEVISFYAAMQR